MPQNEKIDLYSRITKEIFNKSKLFKKGNPQCLIYYVTTGKWTNDTNLVVRKEAEQNEIEAMGLFRKVTFDCVDSDRLQRLYRESQNAVSTEINFSQRTVIPEIPGVEQAYLGLLPATQFLHLVENDNEEILASIFYDNVRHWQEWNPVNTEMKETLLDKNQNIYFPLLNNGVTVVARKITPTGNKLFIEDYQVVNGCQTSYVLHECRDGLSEQVMIPVRLIATQDDNIKNSIIKATNRQTEVTEDQLFALSEFPKKLEAYFNTFKGKHKLLYERRSRQYNGVPGIEKVRVINMTSLVRAFASAFLCIPHRTTRNYKAMLRSIGTEIFNKDHMLEPYYVSAYMHYRLEYLFRSQILPPELKPARYHLLMAYRILVKPQSPPKANAQDMAKYCGDIMETLWDDDQFKIFFEKAAKAVQSVAVGDLHRDNIRTEPFTDTLIKELASS